jgi:hypothetical protein
MDGDAEAGGVGAAGLAATSEFLGEIEEFLTGPAGLFHPYTSAYDRGRWKAGVSRSDTVDGPVGNQRSRDRRFAEGRWRAENSVVMLDDRSRLCFLLLLARRVP